MKNPETKTVSSKRGFTLIELLVVIAIIAILAAIILAALNTARNKARDAAKSEEVHSLITALEEYANSNNSGYPYPQQGGSVLPPGGRGTDGARETCIMNNSSGYCVTDQGANDGTFYSTSGTTDSMGQYMTLPIPGEDSIASAGGYIPSGQNGGVNDVGGIGYWCLVATGTSPNYCTEYAIDWVSTSANSACDGGADLGTAAGTNTSWCVYGSSPKAITDYTTNIYGSGGLMNQ